MNDFFAVLIDFMGTAIAVFVIFLVFLINKRYHKKRAKGKGVGSFSEQVATTIILLVGLIVVIFSLPIDMSLKAQIIGLIGIVLSATFVLGSTTFLGNALAGIMNKTINHFRAGDFITVGDNFGRVTNRGLFHTEIQNEDRTLTTLPNLFLTSNPVKVIRSSGTIINTTVSIGYDVNRLKVESSLKEAALAAGLTDPYVYIVNLGDFSITYKINGFLQNSDYVLTRTSQLNAQVLDKLHEQRIEIVSPTFMNQRRVDTLTFIPKATFVDDSTEHEKTPEEIIFDKAMLAETIEKKEEFISKLKDYIDNLQSKKKEAKTEEEKERLTSEIERWKEKLEKASEAAENDKKTL